MSAARAVRCQMERNSFVLIKGKEDRGKAHTHTHTLRTSMTITDVTVIHMHP